MSKTIKKAIKNPDDLIFKERFKTLISVDALLTKINQTE